MFCRIENSAPIFLHASRYWGGNRHTMWRKSFSAATIFSRQWLQWCYLCSRVNKLSILIRCDRQTEWLKIIPANRARGGKNPRREFYFTPTAHFPSLPNENHVQFSINLLNYNLLVQAQRSVVVVNQLLINE